MEENKIGSSQRKFKCLENDNRVIINYSDGNIDEILVSDELEKEWTVIGMSDLLCLLDKSGYEVKKKPLFFEPDKYYKHTSGHMIHTLVMAETTLWGTTLLAEQAGEDMYVLTAVGIDSEDYTAGYHEITEEEWNTNFSKE